jgi:hypothetical protein
MTERTGTLAEVVQLDKHRRLAYNVKVVEALVRQGLWHMNPYEYMLYMSLLVHTVFLGKDRITLPVRAMEEGLFSDGGWVQVPLPMSRRTLLKSIDGLRKGEFITVVRNKVIPGHGMVNAASTIIINMQKIEHYLSEAKGTDGLTFTYPVEGYTPVVPNTEQPD